MKKLFIFTMSALMMLSLTTTELKANNAPTSTPPTTAEAAEAATLITRLNEIDAMDKSEMKVSEKKALRKEVRSIKGRLNDLGSGVYVSVGAIIIILLLLIILL